MALVTRLGITQRHDHNKRLYIVSANDVKQVSGLRGVQFLAAFLE